MYVYDHEYWNKTPEMDFTILQLKSSCINFEKILASLILRLTKKRGDLIFPGSTLLVSARFNIISHHNTAYYFLDYLILMERSFSLPDNFKPQQCVFSK